MIKNERQYSITKKQLKLFQEALAHWRSNEAPRDVDPIIYQAQGAGISSQIESLAEEIKEYEALKTGDISCISLNSLDELPQGLIKARIARGLNQKQLAELISVKSQQIQRWEFEDYENVNFSSMLDIACALELNISETIRLPSKPQPALTLLKTSGISKAFITARLVPRNWKWKNPQMNNADLLVAASDRLEKIFGYKIDENGIIANDDYFRIAASEARFKIPADADTSRVTAYAVYARHLASIVISATKNLVKKPIPQDPKDLRIALLGKKPLTFENLLNGVWDLGIPVLPLCDPIRFHGVCWRINGKNIIVLKQSIQSESRWSFDLIHELVHASENPDSDFMNAIECDPTEQSRRESEEEVRANNIAGEVLLNGKAQELYQKVLSDSNNNVWQLSNKIKAIAKEEKVNVADLANHVAFRLKEEKFIDFWAMAAQLQPMKNSPFDIAKKVFFERLNLDSLSLEDKELILQALDDIKIQ